MFRQFRHPSSSCLLECASSCVTFTRTNLMALVVDPVSGTVFIDFHVSSRIPLCRLNQSDDFIFAASNLFYITEHQSSSVCAISLFISLCDCAACVQVGDGEEWRGMIVRVAKIAANFACRISRNARLEDDAPAKKAAVGWLYTHTRRCLVCRNLSTA
jgi:hypothetical protein